MSKLDIMNNVYFKITLKQPLIISSQSATAGTHQTLDYIPGSVILGLAAKRLYQSLTPDEAWTIFHSGLIKFSDGLPYANNDLLAYPIPINLHSYKGEKYQDRVNDEIELNQLVADRLFDPSQESDIDKQPVQLRGGYVTHSGITIQPKLEHTLKTAIDSNTGKAAEGQLFGYEAISPSQSYCIKISYHPNVDDALLAKLFAELKGKAQLGRSRSAQFGSVHIQQLDHAPNEWLVQENAKNLTLWLLSDLALESQGMPCLQPRPELLGLPTDTIFDIENSFLRTRRYSPYNAYRRSYDNERQVISRGSVLRFKLNQPLSNETITALRSGIGLFQESGLGQVVVNPKWISTKQPSFDLASFELEPLSRSPNSSQKALNIVKPKPKLIDVLERRLKTDQKERDIRNKALVIFAVLCKAINTARYYKALPTYLPLHDAPSSSQWGRIKALASDLRSNHAELFNQLTGPDGVIRERSGWDIEYGPNQYLYKLMTEQLEKIKEDADFSQIVANLAVLGLTDEWQKYCDGELPVNKAEEILHD